MRIRALAVLLAGLATACTRSGPSSDATSSDLCDEGCTCMVDEDCAAGLLCASRMCVPAEGEGSSSGAADGSSSSGGAEGEASTAADDSSTTSSGISGFGTDDTTGNPGSSSTSEDASSTGSTTAPAPACGDGAVDEDEDCDDGNLEDGDGCDAACAWEPWEHEGVAHDVPAADLHGWSLCWSDDYSGTADLLVSSLAESCVKAQLLVACLPAGSEVLTIAAHAAREDVLFPVDYSEGERHEANGVAWYWEPASVLGFGPAGNSAPCHIQGEDEQMCWKTQVVDNVNTFSFGTRCGPKLGFTDDEALVWQRVVFQR